MNSTFLTSGLHIANITIGLLNFVAISFHHEWTHLAFLLAARSNPPIHLLENLGFALVLLKVLERGSFSLKLSWSASCHRKHVSTLEYRVIKQTWILLRFEFNYSRLIGGFNEDKSTMISTTGYLISTKHKSITTSQRRFITHLMSKSPWSNSLRHWHYLSVFKTA